MTYVSVETTNRATATISINTRSETSFRTSTIDSNSKSTAVTSSNTTFYPKIDTVVTNSQTKDSTSNKVTTTKFDVSSTKMICAGN